MTALKGGRSHLLALFLVSILPLAVAPVVAPPAGASVGFALGALLFLGSAVHYASTGTLAAVPGLRATARTHRIRLIALPAVAGLSSIAIAVVVTRPQFDVVLYAFLAWQFLHFARQNVGVISLAARYASVSPSNMTERRAVVVAGAAGVLGVISQPATLKLPTLPGALVLHTIAVSTFTVSVAWGLKALTRRPRDQRPASFAGVYVVALGFSLPAFIFSNPYAALSGMTIAHGLQYLIVVGTVTAPRVWTRQSILRCLLAVDAIIATGVLIHLTSRPTISSLGARVSFGAYLGVAVAHFLIDSRVWRMRDPEIRAAFIDRIPFVAPPISCVEVVSQIAHAA